MDLKRLCFACDLIDDEELISAYIKKHKSVWPEIKSSIKESGITNMEIYNIGNRLFMIMEVVKDFDIDKKAEMDINNSRVQEWENLMWKYQKQLPWANDGEKWMLLKQIY